MPCHPRSPADIRSSHHKPRRAPAPLGIAEQHPHPADIWTATTSHEEPPAPLGMDEQHPAPLPTSGAHHHPAPMSSTPHHEEHPHHLRTDPHTIRATKSHPHPLGMAEQLPPPADISSSGTDHEEPPTRTPADIWTATTPRTPYIYINAGER